MSENDFDNRKRVFITFATRKGIIGTIKIELYYDIVPKTVDNFMALINNKYKGCKVHRIIPDFMVQMGDYERGDGSGGSSIYGKYFEDENFKVKHSKAGLLSMANAGPDTNGSQFFITLEYCPHLDGKHVVFGEVIDNGMEIVKQIEQYGTLEGSPKETVKIVDCGIL